MYQYTVSFGESIRRAFRNYCNFRGRASRSEFWWFNLFVGLIITGLYILLLAGVIQVVLMSPLSYAAMPGSGVDLILFFPVFLILGFIIAVFLPSLGLLFRRLHDTGRSGWWYLLSFIPYVGSIIILIFCCLPSDPYENDYGEVPNLVY